MASEAGKGSKPRPYSVDSKTFNENWQRIFGSRKKTDAELQAEAWLKDEYYDLDSQDNKTE